VRDERGRDRKTKYRLTELGCGGG
jgi:hypothetical protein